MSTNSNLASTSDATLPTSHWDHGPADGIGLPSLGLRKAFETLRPEIDAVLDTDLSQMNVDVPAAVEVAMKALPGLRALRPRIVDELPRFDLATFDRLDQLAAAASHAHTVWAATSAPTVPVSTLLEEVIAQRELLLSDANALARRGLLDGARVQTLRSPSGYRNAAYDLLNIVRMMRDHFDALQGKTAITPGELDHAERLGEGLLAALVAKDQQQSPNSDAALLRQRAFTLFDCAYDEVRRAVAYLHWHEDDVDELAPSLRMNKGRRRRNSAAESLAEDEAPAFADATVPAATVATAPTQITATNSAAPSPSVGMPGSNPFLAS